jgi:hypothetical protein
MGVNDMFNTAKRLYQGALLSILIGLAPATILFAANPETVTAEVEFVAPITVTTSNNLQFGLISTDIVNLDTIAIATNSTVTDASSRVLGGTQAAANLTVGTTATQAITIAVGAPTNGTGYALSAFLCDYNGGATTGACDGAGLNVASSVASAAVLIGATLTGDGLDVVGAANGSFPVTVSYQ